MIVSHSFRSSPLLIAGLMMATSALSGCRKDAQAAGTNEAARSAVRVQTYDVIEQSMPTTLSLTGTLKGQRQTDLAANALGRVTETFAERGMAVKKGDVLARLDTRTAAMTAAEARANVELARAQRDTAARECERYAKLREREAVSQLEFDRQTDQCITSKLSVVAAEVRAQSASQIVGDGVIRAPFSGVIAERYVDTGEYVRQDSRVVTIVELDPLRLEFTVSEVNVGKVHQGAAVSFTVPAFPDRTFEGTVQFIGAAVREGTRDLVAEAVVPNADKTLRPGMFASLTLTVGEAPVAVIPKAAIQVREGRSQVYAVVDHRLETRVVQTGHEKGDIIAVPRGLRAHDKIVSQVSDNLSNGLAVD